MDVAIALALFSGTMWGVNMVIARWSLAKTGASSDVGALVSIGGATLVAAVIALVSGADTAGITIGSIARFSIVGAIAPGAAQVVFMAAIRTIGSARAGVLIGTAPMFAVILAILFLDEGWRVPIIIGTAATVVGGILLSWDKGATNNEAVRKLGVAFAALTAIAFGVRDVVARHFTSGADLEVAWAAVIVLAAGSIALLAITLFRTRAIIAEVKTALPSMAWSSLVVGCALPALLASLSRGEVGTVAPINNASQVITVVVLSAMFFGKRERTFRVIAALGLIVAGGTLIGLTQ